MEPTANIIPLAENLFWIQAPGRGKYPYCNGFLITGKETVLVDAGIGEQLIREIDAKQRIDCLVISHSHPDHMLRWHLLKDRHLMMPQETPDSIQDFFLLGRRFTSTEKQAELWKKRVADGFGLKQLRLPDSRFADGDVIDFGEVHLEAIHAPGHLNDHYCFLVREAGVLLTVDIDFDSFGPWYGNPESDISLFKQSIEKVRRFPCQQVCSSHKPPIAGENAQQAFDDYLSSLYRQRQLILNLCRQPKSISDLVLESPIYRNKMPDINFQRIFEERIIQKNLDLMVAEGLVLKHNNRYVREPGAGPDMP